MSAHSDLMEREYSVRSLSSRAGSDMGSRYTVESGIYMSSFAATIFVAALVTVGVLLMTLLIALTVMLQSCESKSAGVVEMWKSTADFSYCRTFALHVELNSLGADSMPLICRDVAGRYIKEGQYMRDLNITLSVIENYFSTATPLAKGLSVVLMDIDDILPSDSVYTQPFVHRFDDNGCTDCLEVAKHQKYIFLEKISIKLQSSGWPLILLSRKPEKLRNITEEYLISAGCGGWSLLVMRADDELKMDSREYFTRRMYVIQAQGIHIAAVISSYMDALADPQKGRNIFKVPNPIYYNKQHFTEGKNYVS